MDPKFPQLDMYYVAEVLSELLSRTRGYDVKVVLTPKEGAASPKQEPTGG